MANSSYVNILFTALGGIDGSVMPIIWFIAASILTVTFLWGVYDAFVRGGDVRSLGITLLKYAAVALVLIVGQGFLLETLTRRLLGWVKARWEE